MFSIVAELVAKQPELLIKAGAADTITESKKISVGWSERIGSVGGFARVKINADSKTGELSTSVSPACEREPVVSGGCLSIVMPATWNTGRNRKVGTLW